MSVQLFDQHGHLIEQSDAESGTFTRWDAEGNVIEQRPLTADEIAALTPPPSVTSPDEKLAAAASALAALDGIVAPVKAADLDAMQRSIAKLKANRAALKAGTGTNGERIKRCEDALVDLTRAILVMTGVAGTDDRA